jgi:uncharacterized protein YbcI
MAGTQEQDSTALQAVSNAMVTLHKEQFGRGPTSSRANFAGPDALMCVLRDVLLPAELKMVQMGDRQRVRESRTAFQAATANDFVARVEEIVSRKVIGFTSAVDPDSNIVFECFYFEPLQSGADGDGTPAAERAGELDPAR